MNIETDITEIPERISLYPIKYKDLWQYYINHLSAFWTPSDMELTKDADHWKNKLNDDERHFIKYTLAFFASSDFLVVKNQQMDNINLLEYRFFNDDKIARENIHSQTYADLLEAYISDAEEIEHLKNAIVSIPIIKEKADWYMHNIQKGDFTHRLLITAIMEGIFFSGSFCSIFWLRHKGLMPGLGDANDLIARDEGMHRDFACLVYKNYVKYKIPESDVIKMVEDAVEIEQRFCEESLPVKLIGMNVELMKKYIEYVADHLLVNLIGKKHYHSENPFPFVSIISQQVKANFFESRSVNYAKQSLLTNKEENMLKLVDDF